MLNSHHISGIAIVCYYIRQVAALVSAEVMCFTKCSLVFNLKLYFLNLLSYRKESDVKYWNII